MKRSEINRALRDMESMLEKYRFALPPFCHYTPEDWQTKGHDHDEIRDNMLGWDITDYGLGDFNKVGFSLITLRNGNLAMSDKYAKTYAEKLLFIKEGQYSPNHFHWHKMEDTEDMQRRFDELLKKHGGQVTDSSLTREDGFLRMEITAKLEPPISHEEALAFMKENTGVRRMSV